MITRAQPPCVREEMKRLRSESTNSITRDVGGLNTSQSQVITLKGQRKRARGVLRTGAALLQNPQQNFERKPAERNIALGHRALDIIRLHQCSLKGQQQDASPCAEGGPQHGQHTQQHGQCKCRYSCCQERGKCPGVATKQVMPFYGLLSPAASLAPLQLHSSTPNQCTPTLLMVRVLVLLQLACAETAVAL